MVRMLTLPLLLIVTNLARTCIIRPYTKLNRIHKGKPHSRMSYSGDGRSTDPQGFQPFPEPAFDPSRLDLKLHNKNIPHLALDNVHYWKRRIFDALGNEMCRILYHNLLG